MMPGEIHEALSQEEHPLQTRLLDWSRRRIQASENYMAGAYPRWRANERLLRSFRDPDQEDLEVSSKPITEGVRKIVVPTTYAMIQSILAWQMSFFTERKPIIPVEGLGPRDVRPAIVHEHLLEYQFDRGEPKGILSLLQWLLDSMTYGVGVVFNAWTIREFLGFVRKYSPIEMNGEVMGYDDDVREQDMIAYEGNQMVNVLPFDWLPDPRFPIGRFQEGEFLAYRMRKSFTEAQVKEAEGLFCGLEWVPTTRIESDKGTASSSWNDSELGTTLGLDQEGGAYIDADGRPPLTLHHMYALIPPKVLRLQSGTLGGSSLPRMWVLTVANKARVIRLEPANLPCRKFPCAIIEPNFNLHSPMNPGYVDVVAGSAYHANWLVNSRTANVRRSLNFEIVYDPSLIERVDLESPNASGLIRLKPDAYQGNVPLNQIVQQFPVSDVTAGHIGDMKVWTEIMENSIGANRMIQGLANTGRRAATEVQATMSLAAGRMKLQSLIAALQGLGNISEQMIENNKTFIVERLMVPTLQAYKDVVGQDFMQITPEMLQGNFRVALMEQGIPTDKAFHANVLREVLQMMLQNPQVVQQFGTIINTPEIFFDLMRVLGKKDLSNYVISPQQRAQQQAQQPPPQVQVMPDGQVQQQVDAGNLIPYTNGMPPGGGGGANMMA